MSHTIIKSINQSFLFSKLAELLTVFSGPLTTSKMIFIDSVHHVSFLFSNYITSAVSINGHTRFLLCPELFFGSKTTHTHKQRSGMDGSANECSELHVFTLN